MPQMPHESSRESGRRLMSRAALATLAAAGLWTGVSGRLWGGADEPLVGQPAPAFTATDSEGHTRRLDDFRGKTVVLEWTNADCPFTRKHYRSGNMQSIQALAQKNGVIWLTVISSAPG